MTAGGTLSLKTGDGVSFYGLFFSVSILDRDNVLSKTRREQKSLDLGYKLNEDRVDKFTVDVEDDNYANDYMFHKDNYSDYEIFIEDLE